MSSEAQPPALAEDQVIVAEDVGKVYQIYERPSDRLREFLTVGSRAFHRKFWALRHVSFEVRRGETVGFLGRNGAGKSTLLQIVAGTLPPTEGQVVLRGRLSALLELGTGFNPEFTGRENVLLYSRILGLNDAEIAERYDRILTFADIRVDPDRFEAWRGERPLRLTRTEFSLLEVLVRNATRVLSRDALFEAIWGFDMSTTANNLQVYVSYLRRKMEAEGEPRLIYTLRGLGYTLRETPP